MKMSEGMINTSSPFYCSRCRAEGDEQRKEKKEKKDSFQIENEKWKTKMNNENRIEVHLNDKLKTDVDRSAKRVK